MIDWMTNMLHRLRLLPILIVVAMLAFIVRVGDTFFEVRNIRGAALAAESEKEKEKEKAKPAKAEPAPSLSATPPKEALADPKAVAGKLENPAAVPAKGTAISRQDEPDDDEPGDIRDEVFRDLAQRREIIEEKEKDIDRREALLKAGTEEMNRKIEELTAIRNEIQSLLKKQTTEEEANTTRLVKIYEGMKPKEAARIFNELDMDVLLPVVTKMSERKASPIIALMDAEKARALTLFLSEQNRLPAASAASSGGWGKPAQTNAARAPASR